MATDLRVSLTDRCNLRCTYCMPAEGLDWLPRDEVLTDDEILRLIEIGVTRLGIGPSGSPAASPCCARTWSSWSAAIAALQPTPARSR